METKINFKNSKGEKLVGLLADLSKEKVVILCHGHSSGKNNKTFETIVPILNKAGVSTFRFDFYGNGESEGKFEESDLSESIDDTLQAIKLIKDKNFKKIILLGSSFGGLSSTITASQTGDLYALILKSPVSDYDEAFLYMHGKQWMDEWEKKGQTYKDKEKGLKLNFSFVESYRKYDAYKSAETIKIPTIIIHGNADEIVPFSQSEKLVKIIPNAKLITVEGASHRYEGSEKFNQMTKLITDSIIKL